MSLHTRGFIHLILNIIKSRAWCFFIPELWPPGDWAEVPDEGRCQSRWPFVFAHSQHPSDKTEPTLCQPRSGGSEEKLMNIFSFLCNLRHLSFNRESFCVNSLLTVNWGSRIHSLLKKTGGKNIGILTLTSVWWISTQRAGRICENNSKWKTEVSGMTKNVIYKGLMIAEMHDLELYQCLLHLNILQNI